jgi:hypothetical protein
MNINLQILVKNIKKLLYKIKLFIFIYFHFLKIIKKKLIFL